MGMGNQSSIVYSSLSNIFKKKKNHLPIEALFELPSALPSWPPGEGFATGKIDLGGLEVCEISTFNKVWATHGGGPDNLGATFFEPAPIPDDFFMFGCYSQSNNKPLSGWTLAGKDTTNGPSTGAALRPPNDYTLVWSSENLKIKQDGIGYIWLPIAPNGYKAIGLIVTNSPQKPTLNRVRCVRLDFTDSNENESWIWGIGKSTDPNGINVYTTRPRDRGVEAKGIPTGTFVVQNTSGLDLPCLKNVNGKLNYMPNLYQINALVQTYSPYIYFHPDEQYFPSSVTWFFENGALLYTKGEETKPISIDPTGSNLPQGGGNDGAYWIDLPSDDSSKEKVKKGGLPSACAYLHVKPMFGGTYNDIAIWVFYPFNGPAKAKVGIINIPFDKIGEHVGDWEHITLRISNFNGELKSMYFSQHSKGVWLDAPDLEFESGNKPVAYSSLHGHACYPKQGLVLQGNGNIGIRNDSGKGKFFMDVGSKYAVVSADYFGAVEATVEPPWLNYAREWGPKLSYSIDDELRKVEKGLIKPLRSVFEKIIKSLPNEVLGEEGPTGPKGKDNWFGDERS